MDNEKVFWKKIKNNKKIAIIIVSGLIIGQKRHGLRAPRKTDSWNIGDGWMFLKRQAIAK